MEANYRLVNKRTHSFFNIKGYPEKSSVDTPPYKISFCASKKIYHCTYDIHRCAYSTNPKPNVRQGKIVITIITNIQSAILTGASVYRHPLQ